MEALLAGTGDGGDDARRGIDHADAGVAVVGYVEVTVTALTVTAMGEASMASVAGPPSPEYPCSPFPATVVMIPFEGSTPADCGRSSGRR